jgi:secreted protein with Ig-like and vWFA domain
MNNDDNFTRNSGDLSPELEARVVAWVLGEASAFEAAQLEVLCAEQPELAVFKRRLEAVHGLVGEAVKLSLNTTPLLLSPERRAKVLAVIGGDAPTIESVVAAPVKTRKQSRSWRSWALPMAACFTMMALLSAVIIPTVGSVKKKAFFSAEVSERGQLEHRVMALDLPAETSEVVNSSASAIYPSENKASSLGNREISVNGYTGAAYTISGSVTERPTQVFFDKAMAGSGLAATDADTPAMPPPPASPVATSKPTTVMITAGTPLKFTAREVSESERAEVLRDQGQALAFADDMAGAKRGDLAFGDQSNVRLKSVAAEVRYRRQIRPSSAADPFAAPAAQASGEYVATRSLSEEKQNQVSVTGGDQFAGGSLMAARQPLKALDEISSLDKDSNPFLATLEKTKSSEDELKTMPQHAGKIEEVSNAWQRPGVYTGSTVATSGSLLVGSDAALSAPASSGLYGKMRRIVIPEAKFKDVPLSKVIASLSAVSAEYDRSDEKDAGATIILIDPTANDPLVTMTLRNLSLSRILDLVTDSTGYRYEVVADTVVVRPGRQAEKFVYEFFPISHTVLQRLLEASGEKLKSGDESRGIQTFLQNAGVDFSVEGSAVVYDGAALIVQQTSQNIERIRTILKRYQAEYDVNERSDVEKLRAETSTATESVSTFSLHVSDASFRLAKAALERGQAPDPATIRPEEFYNAFDYGDPSPAAGEAVSCRVEQAAHPFLQQRNLVRIAMKVPAAGRGSGQPLRLTVMLDTSGSMEREDRAATVRAALTALTSLLGPDDRVTLVGFARTPTLLAESVPGDQAAKIIELAARTPAEGGTNLEEALALAGKLAMRQKLATAQNRIVLLTDGAANLGDADPQALAKRVEALRQNGIAFDACGVVADGLDDSVLEALTRKGDGRYAVVNSPEEADANFARQLAGAFRPAAKDVKVQVHFNPARVARYRLIGFEKHRLKTEDFRNDKVDAAELATEEAAVAVYQVEVLPEGEGELGEVAVRFLDTRSNERVERSWTLAYSAQPAAFARATPSLQLAGSAAFLSEKLRGGALAGQVRLDEFAPVVEGLGAAYPNAPRVREFIEMFRQTRRMTGE